jgi:hypothetical protein
MIEAEGGRLKAEGTPPKVNKEFSPLFFKEGLGEIFG